MGRPAVEDARPPKAVLKLVNPIMRALLPSGRQPTPEEIAPVLAHRVIAYLKLAD